MLLLTFVYAPATAPVTVTLIAQDPLAANDPLASEIVRGEVVVTVPPQADELPEATVKPAGKTSVKDIPLRAEAVFGFAIENVSVLVVPVPMLTGEKLLESVGGSGSKHPLMVISSKYIVPVVAEGLPLYCAPAAKIRKYTVLAVLVVVPVMAGEAPFGTQALPLSHTLVFNPVHVVPSVLVSTYQLPEFDKLSRKLYLEEICIPPKRVDVV